MNSEELETIKQRYEAAKKLAKDLWLDGDHEGDNNDFYYFQCGFVAGLNYQRNQALNKLNEYDQELGLQ